jgi:hypothetical protein
MSCSKLVADDDDMDTDTSEVFASASSSQTVLGENLTPNLQMVYLWLRQFILLITF